MTRGKQTDPKVWEKLIVAMISGKQISKEEVAATLSNELEVYRLSTYIWDIKVKAGGVIKAIKDGRKVVAYQLMNVDEVTKYLAKRGISTTVAKAKTKSVKKLADLGAQETATETAETVTETATAEQTS
jgi:hypothetical protein